MKTTCRNDIRSEQDASTQEVRKDDETVYTSLMLQSSPDEWDKTSEIIDSQVNGQDERQVEAMMQIVAKEEEEEEYLPR